VDNHCTCAFFGGQIGTLLIGFVFCICIEFADKILTFAVFKAVAFTTKRN